MSRGRAGNAFHCKWKDTPFDSGAGLQLSKVNIILKANDFIAEIESLSREKKISYLDALMFYVEKYGIEPETVASVVKKNAAFKSKLQEECAELNLVAPKS